MKVFYVQDLVNKVVFHLVRILLQLHMATLFWFKGEAKGLLCCTRVLIKKTDEELTDQSFAKYLLNDICVFRVVYGTFWSIYLPGDVIHYRPKEQDVSFGQKMRVNEFSSSGLALFYIVL